MLTVLMREPGSGCGLSTGCFRHLHFSRRPTTTCHARGTVCAAPDASVTSAMRRPGFPLHGARIEVNSLGKLCHILVRHGD